MTLLGADILPVAVARDAEAALLERARRMDADAWDDLYSTHYAAIFRYCSLRISDPETAEDLAADVFLEAVKGIERYRYRGTPFRAWLYRIAHNLTADERRARIRRGAVDAAPTAAEEPRERDFAPAVQSRQDFETALARLTGDQQQVVILRFIEGLSLAETAVAMERPAGAIKALQFRATRRLRALLEGEVG